MVLDLGKVAGGPRSILRHFSIIGATFACHLAAGRLGEASLSCGLRLYTWTCSVLCYSNEEDVIGDFRHKSLESLLY